MKWIVIILFLLSHQGVSQNTQVAKIAQSLKFSGLWKVAQRGKTTQLKLGDTLVSYQGSSRYPKTSSYHVGTAKTFARIIVDLEGGYFLPQGSNYATKSPSLAQPGDILQRSGSRPHTMVVTKVSNKGIFVIHVNWIAKHQLLQGIFSSSWLTKNGFRLYKVQQKKTNRNIATSKTNRAPTISKTTSTSKSSIISKLKKVSKNHYQLKIAGATVDIPPSSWQRARSAGYSVKSMLKKVDSRSFVFIEDLIKNFNITYLRCSSLWRPGSGPHNSGRGIDITKVRCKNGQEVVFFNKIRKAKEPSLAKKIRLYAWQHRLTTQVITPWYHQGVNGYPSGWRRNYLKPGVEWMHHHHLHVTIRR